MKTEIKDFCNYYLNKLNLDKDIKERKLEWNQDFRERIKFHITEYETTPNTTIIGEYHGRNLFVLDDEDLKYLYNKYRSFLQKELDDNIEKLKKDYKLK